MTQEFKNSKNLILGSPVKFTYPEEQCFDEIPNQNLNVHQRTQIWKKVKHNKIKAMRNKSKGKGLEECTFKPNLIKRSRSKGSLRNSKSLQGLQTINSIQKYVGRMNGVRENKDYKQIQEDKKMGSGKNWTHRITVPNEPVLSYQKVRNRSKRKNISIERNISKELIARNISLKDINTKEYMKDDCFKYSVHNHYYEESDSETMLQGNVNHQMKIEKGILAERILESNDSRISNLSLHKSEDGSIFNQQSELTQSISKLERIKRQAISQLSPHGIQNNRKTPETAPRISKPPLAPSG